MANRLTRLLFCLVALSALPAAADDDGAFPSSEIAYPGASTDTPFEAREPYYIKINGINRLADLHGAPRTFDFGGTTDFVNPENAAANPRLIAGQDARSRRCLTADPATLAEAALPGRVEQREGYTVLRAGPARNSPSDSCGAILESYAVPPRTHVRWEVAVSFGAADKPDNWDLTPPGANPVTFWQLRNEAAAGDENGSPDSAGAGNPSLYAAVDTDPQDPKHALMIAFYEKGADPSNPWIPLGQAHHIARNTLVPIVVDAFLDERNADKQGRGRTQVWVGNVLLSDVSGPNLLELPGENIWRLGADATPQAGARAHTRTLVFETARMFVYPPATGDN